MPNPQFPGLSRRDMPLGEAVGYASHVRITCKPPVGPQFPPCGRWAIWQTSELQAKFPNAKTLGDMMEHLVCSKCGRRGWVSVDPEGR
jgi:hypothetical protein